MPDLVVVPTPLRRTRGARRLCDAQGGLLLGPRVATPRELVPGLLAAAGEGRVVLSPLAERILALAASRDAGLVPAGTGAGGAGRAAASLLAELRRGEVTSADLRQAAAGAAGRAGERLRAVAAALEGYEERLAALDALDAAAALRVAARAVARGAASEETGDLGLLVLEGLLPADPALLDLVATLATRARRVVAAIPWRTDEPGPSIVAEPWVRRMESLHEVAARRDVEVRFPPETPPGRAVRALAAGSDDEQAEGAARLAGELLDGGMDPEDVAVVAPARLSDRLARAFREARVPLALDGAEPLAAHPLVRDLRAALRGADGLGREDAELLLASPYLQLGPSLPGAGRLLDRAGALPGRGDPEERLRGRAALLSAGGPGGAERERLLRGADAVAELRASLAQLPGVARPRQWAGRLRGFLDRAGVRRRAGRGDPALARHDLLAVARLEEVVDDLALALGTAGRGEEAVGRAEWAALLDLAVGLASVPGGETPAAGAVEAWEPADAPGLEARAVLVLGAERGAWPAVAPSDPLLGEAARRELNGHLRRRAVATSAWRQAGAELAGLAALAAGRELVAVGWTAGPEGAAPAPLAARVLGAAERTRVADPPVERARVPADVLRAAARAARDGDAVVTVEAAVPVDAPDGLPARIRAAVARGAMERERREAWLAGRSSPWAGGLEGGAGEAWRAALPSEWSATQLETHARCPYRFFLGTMGLREPGEVGLDVARGDEGSLLHAALEAILRTRRERGAGPIDGGAADREEARRVAGEVLERFAAEGRAGDAATWPGKREVLLGRVERWLASEAEMRDGLAPVLLEHRFGSGAAAPPVVIPVEGGEIRLQGRIDRVDADAGRLLVLDYKDTRDGRDLGDRLEPDAMGVESFQAPVYLLAAAQALPGRAELGATYVLLRSGERLPPWTIPAGDGFLALPEARRAEVRASGGRTFADAVAAAVGRIRSGDLPVAPRDCRGCPFGAVCRFPERGEA